MLKLSILLVILTYAFSQVTLSIIISGSDLGIFDDPVIYQVPKYKSSFCHGIRHVFTEPGMSTHCEEVITSEVKLVSTGDHDLDEVIVCFNDDLYQLDYANAARFVMTIQILDKLLKIQVNVVCKVDWGPTIVNSAFEFVKRHISSRNFSSIEAYRDSLIQNSILLNAPSMPMQLGFTPEELDNVPSEWKFSNNEISSDFFDLLNKTMIQSVNENSIVDVAASNMFEQMDIVLAVENDLNFLYNWKSIIWKFHFIIIQYGKLENSLSIPNWLDYQLYTSKEIEALLGNKAYIFSLNSQYCKSFGYLVSKRKYIYTMEVDSVPNGDVLLEHWKNLMKPSLPYMSHISNDPYIDPIENFMVGYPYRLRSGVQTVISHGRKIQIDPHHSEWGMGYLKYNNISHTVPKGSLYIMSDTNMVCF